MFLVSFGCTWISWSQPKSLFPNRGLTTKSPLQCSNLSLPCDEFLMVVLLPCTSVCLRFLSVSLEHAWWEPSRALKHLCELKPQIRCTKGWPNLGFFSSTISNYPGGPQTYWPGTVFHHPVAFSVFSSRLHLLAVLVITWGSVPAEWAPRTSWRCSWWIPSPYWRPWTRCNRVRSRSPRGSWGRRRESRRSWTCHLWTSLQPVSQQVWNIWWCLRLKKVDKT